MIDKLIRWSLNNRVVVVCLAAAFGIWWVYGIAGLPV